MNGLRLALHLSEVVHKFVWFGAVVATFNFRGNMLQWPDYHCSFDVLNAFAQHM